MDSNNIVTAPQVRDVGSLYEAWRADHVGSREDFYSFMVTPSVDRELFMSCCDMAIGFVGQAACPVITERLC